jgi:hypothetical protein
MQHRMTLILTFSLREKELLSLWERAGVRAAWFAGRR